MDVANFEFNKPKQSVITNSELAIYLQVTYSTHRTEKQKVVFQTTTRAFLFVRDLKSHKLTEWQNVHSLVIIFSILVIKQITFFIKTHLFFFKFS
jgi:hypothetical protein